MPTQTSLVVAQGDTVRASDHNKLVADIAAIIADIKSVPRRQTVLAGAVDASGQASLLQNNTTSVGLLATSVPVSLTFAAGFNSLGALDYVCRIAADAPAAWSGLAANATSYLYVERNATTGLVSYGASVRAPVYAATAPAASSLATPIMTSNTAPSGTASATTTAVGYDPYKAFNGTTSGSTDAWLSDGSATISAGAPTGLRYQFPTAKTIRRFRFKSINNTEYNYPNKWKLRGSNNGSTWTDLFTAYESSGLSGDAANRPPSANAYTGWFSIPLPASYTYYEVYITERHSVGGAGNPWVAIGELELMEYASGEHWFDLSAFTMKAWSGTTWEDKQRVFVGEAAMGATTISSVTSYALQGQYAPGRIAASASTATTKNHNIGCDILDAQVFEATSAAGSLRAVAITGLTANTVTLTTGASVVEIQPVIRRAF